MGELVPGIGDEVLLFATFLVLSACMYLSVLLYKSYGNQQNTQRLVSQVRADSTHHEEVATNVNDGGDNETALSSSQSERQPSSNTQSTVRSRFHSTSPTASEPETSQSGSQATTTSLQTDSENNTNAGQAEPRERLIKIRLIHSNDTRTVEVAPNSVLQDLRNSYFRDEVAEARPVRFIFQGRVLREDSATLMSLGITDGHAIHVHVGVPRPPGEIPHREEDADQDLDLSRLFVPLFGVILGLVWVTLLMYPYVFNFITKFFLFLLSLAYVVLSYVTNFG